VVVIDFVGVRVGRVGAVDTDAVPGTVWAGFDPYPKLDSLAKPSAEGVDDGCAQVPFYLVLDEGTRDGEEGEALCDGERLDELEPGTLLWGKGGIENGDRVLGSGIAAKSHIAVQFGYHRTPDRGEIRAICHRWIPLTSLLNAERLAPVQTVHMFIHRCAQGWSLVAVAY
jgi:hypothetical protein